MNNKKGQFESTFYKKRSPSCFIRKYKILIYVIHYFVCTVYPTWCLALSLHYRLQRELAAVRRGVLGGGGGAIWTIFDNEVLLRPVGNHDQERCKSGYLLLGKYYHNGVDFFLKSDLIIILSDKDSTGDPLMVWFPLVQFSLVSDFTVCNFMKISALISYIRCWENMYAGLP